MKVLILGAYGLLGETLSRYLAERGYSLFRHGRRKESEYSYDLINYSDVIELFLETKPDYVINLSAATNVDQCETNILNAYQLNAKIVENIIHAKVECNLNFQLIHLSTDQVYSGTGYQKEESAAPVNVYSLSKYLGEKIAENGEAIIFRTNFFGKSRSADRVSFSDWIVQSLQNRKEITIFEDVWFNPLYMGTLSQVIEKSLLKEIKPGIYNAGSENGLTKADFALHLAQTLKLDSGLMNIGKSSDLDLKATRPKDMRMDLSRLKEEIGFEMPDLKSEIELAAKEYV